MYFSVFSVTHFLVAW